MTARSERLTRVVATTLALASVALITSASLIWGAGGFRELPTSFGRSSLVIVTGMFAALCYLGAGGLLTSRVPRNPIGWLMLTMGLVFALMTPTALLVDTAHRALRPAAPTTLGIAWLVSSFSGPILVGAGVSAGLLFPDGRLAGSRWRWALSILIVGAGLLAIATGVRPGGLIWYPSLPNPLSVPTAGKPLVSIATAAGTVMVLIGAGAMAASLVARYRNGGSTVRAQVRWIMYAGTALTAALVPFMAVRFLFPVAEAMGEVLVVSANVAAAMLPIAGTVAITRYRLFGIDMIISRTLVYVPMMAILSGMYTASIAIFQRIFVAITGETSDAPLVLTIFLVAAAFTPVRRSLEGLVDRWTRGAGQTGPVGPDVSDSITPDVAEVAARVVALQTLEARVRAPQERHPSLEARQSLSIDTEGRVACPRDGRPHFVACLSCQHLAGITTAPAAVVCTAPRSSEVTTAPS